MRSLRSKVPARRGHTGEELRLRLRRNIQLLGCSPIVCYQWFAMEFLESCERIAIRRRNRLRHQDKSRACTGGADGFLCLAPLRAFLSRRLTGAALLGVSNVCRLSDPRPLDI